MDEKFYIWNAHEVLKKLNSSLTGLSHSSVVAGIQKFGQNSLPEPKQKSKISMLLSQFKDVMIVLLVCAAFVSFLSGEHIDAVVILIIVLGNAWLGFSQEYGAEQSIRMLQQMTSQSTIVIREGISKKIDAKGLVPGDIIVLSAGDMVPADARLIQINSLKTEESSLTGESNAVVKQLDALPIGAEIVADQTNMVFKGTIVSNGSAKAVVTGTGRHTEVGKIAGMLAKPSPKTPLQKKLAAFSKQLVVIVIIICFVVFLFGWLRGEPILPMFLTALSLAVAALPEALPAVITIALATGARRLVKQHALIRKLPSVETLGSVTYICSDKTGTLTQNIMKVEQVDHQPDLEDMLLSAMLLNNEVRFGNDEEMLGDPTETALVKYAIKKGATKQKCEKLFPLIAQFPFNSERMRMGTLHSYNGKWILFVKGAPSKVLEVLDSVTKYNQSLWLEQNRKWAGEGLRVLFFAYKIFDTKPLPINEKLEVELNFLGMVAMIDPPRTEVVEAIRKCHSAGIKTVMITGDQPLTAMAIAKRLGMMVADAENIKTGAALDKLSDAEFKKVVLDTAVYGRVSPEQKLRIVKSLQDSGEFVAMTGDGVNDSPSLKQADIGVAMGITGTDVSKQAADMILLDDNFTTIVKAIKEGRRIFDNVKNFIVYILSCNLAEILVIFSAPLFGFSIPLLPIHILWINLVTDGLPGIALVAEPAKKDVMERKPRPTNENLFTKPLVTNIIATGVIMTVAVLFMQWWAIKNGYDLPTQRTIVFFGICLMQLMNAISVSAGRHLIIATKVFANKTMWIVLLITLLLQVVVVYVPFFHVVLKTTSLNFQVMKMVMITCTAFFVIVECIKLFNKKPK